MWCLLLVFVLTVSGYQICSVEYPVLMVHRNPETRIEADQIQFDNVDHWVDVMEERRNCSMFVFPEYGLYPLISQKREVYELYGQRIDVGEMPLDVDDQKVIYRIAELSRKMGAVIVANLVDSEHGKLYNTQVAVDNGVVKGKYHKFHLFGNEGKYFDSGDGVGVSFITSGFEFGMIICFDIMFADPTMGLIDKGVKNVIMSSLWVNFPPMLNALQAMQSYSYIYGVNLIASNNGFSNMSSGSGIFHKGESKAVFFNSEMHPKKGVVCYDFNDEDLKSGISRRINDHKSEKNSEKNLKFEVLNLSEISSNMTIIEIQNVHCNITYKTARTHTTDQYYAVFVATGKSLIEKSAGLCGLIFCGNSHDDCESVLNFKTREILTTDIEFEFIEINARFTEQYFKVFPYIAEEEMGTFNSEYLFYENSNDTYYATYEPRENKVILTFMLSALSST